MGLLLRTTAPPPLTLMLLTGQSTIVYKTTAPPRNRTRVAGVTHVGPEFCCGSPAAARTVNAAGRAVAIEEGILMLDAEVGGGEWGGGAHRQCRGQGGGHRRGDFDAGCGGACGRGRGGGRY